MAKVKRICSIEGCCNPYVAKGLCSKHYNQAAHRARYQFKSSQASNRKDFLKNLVCTDQQDCITWPFSRHKKNGYGRCRLGKVTDAHRVMCIMAHGEPPSSTHHAAHSCGNGHLGCVNPNHLRWATPFENYEDRLAHGAKSGSVSEFDRKRKLTEQTVKRIRIAFRKARSNYAISKDFCISEGTVRDIRLRKTWKNLV